MFINLLLVPEDMQNESCSIEIFLEGQNASFFNSLNRSLLVSACEFLLYTVQYIELLFIPLVITSQEMRQKLQVTVTVYIITVHTGIMCNRHCIHST